MKFHCLKKILFLSLLTALVYGDRLDAQTVFIADSNDNHIRTVSPSGVVSDFVVGSVPTQIVTDGSGNLYYTSALGRVYKVDAGGNQTVFVDFASTDNHPISMAFDSAGNLFVAQDSFNQLQRVSPTGLVNNVYDLGAYRISSLTYGGGYLYIAPVTGGIVKMDGDGAISAFASEALISSTGTIAYSGGSLYAIAPNDVILKYDASGNASNFSTLSHFTTTEPYAIAADGMGGLFATGLEDRALYQIDSSGIATVFAADIATGFNPAFVAASAIPEPSTYALIVGAAILGLAVWRRRGLCVRTDILN